MILCSLTLGAHALAAVYTCNQLQMCGISKKTSVQSYGVKNQYANELELTANRFHALSGPAKRRRMTGRSNVASDGGTGVKQARSG